MEFWSLEFVMLSASLELLKYAFNFATFSIKFLTDINASLISARKVVITRDERKNAPVLLIFIHKISSMNEVNTFNTEEDVLKHIKDFDRKKV